MKRLLTVLSALLLVCGSGCSTQPDNSTIGGNESTKPSDSIGGSTANGDNADGKSGAPNQLADNSNGSSGGRPDVSNNNAGTEKPAGAGVTSGGSRTGSTTQTGVTQASSDGDIDSTTPKKIDSRATAFVEFHRVLFSRIQKRIQEKNKQSGSSTDKKKP